MKDRIEILQNCRIEILEQIQDELYEIHTECLQNNISTRHQIFETLFDYIDTKITQEVRVSQLREKNAKS
jgi:hypothetical protein